MSELRRLIVRHRHVAPMVSALLAGLDEAVLVRDDAGEVILDRAGAGGGPNHHDVVVDGDILGRVEGGRTARGVAAVLSYAAARERDKRSLANEALERYRELSLIYDLAAAIGIHTDLEPIVTTALDELGRLPHDAVGFLLLASPGGALETPAGVEAPGRIDAARAGEGIIGAVAASGVPELVERTMDDPRATATERTAGTLVVAPLRAGDHAIGVLGAGGHGGVFRAADLKVVTAIAALAGPAIARALADAGDGADA
jgi:transcriptional regulator with GAF, ATPase, and Fis domain